MPVDPLQLDLPEVLEGSRVTVRTYRIEDASAIVAGIAESRDNLLPWMPWAVTPDPLSVVEERTNTWRTDWTARTDLTYGMFDSASGEFLGGTGLHRPRWEIPSLEIGYWIRTSKQGQGYVTDAVRLMTEIAFAHAKAERLFIRSAVGNQRSWAVAERAGFQFEGVLRRDVIDAEGRLHDVRIYSLIRDEYQREQGRF